MNGANRPTIYISHAWGGESEKLVQKIMHKFAKEGIEITLDKKDLGYRQSINAFMERLGEADAIIIVVSNKYLHSEYCMFELLQIYENKNILERIFPVVLDEVNIAKSTNRLDLVKYWENQTKELENKIRDLDSISNIEGITEDLNLYQNIRTKIAKLTSILKDINTLNIQLHTESDFDILFQAVKKRLDHHPFNQPVTPEAKVADLAANSPVASAAASSEPAVTMYTPPASPARKKKNWLWLMLPLVLIAGWFVWSYSSKNTLSTESQNSENKQDISLLNQPEQTISPAEPAANSPSNTSSEATPPAGKKQSPATEPQKNNASDPPLVNTRPPAGTTFQQMKLILDRSVRNAQVLIDNKTLNAWSASKALNIIQVELPTGTHTFRLIQGKDTCQYQQVINPNEFELTLKCQ